MDILKSGTGYDIVAVETTWPGGQTYRVIGIRCHTCQRVSYAPEDIVERYCGQCLVFHEAHLFLPES
jgi:uncharacterized OB-fold protein